MDKKTTLSLSDLKVVSLVSVLDEELSRAGGAVGAATDDFNCNSNIGSTNTLCCSTTIHACCQTEESEISTGICCPV